MPEGPEVKLSADVIRPLVEGKRVVEAFPSKTGRYAGTNPEGLAKFLDDLSKGTVRVEKINVKGKFMYWSFDNGWYMFSTFGMTGQWSPVAGKHPCFGFHFRETLTDNVETMYFNDHRHFGTIKFTDNVLDVRDKLDELGWDPLAMSLSDQNLRWVSHQLSKTTKPIAEVLMDQTVFAGVGNYIRAEALYLSKLSPWRQSNHLSQDEILTLCKSIYDVMQESYNHQGATIQTYKTVYGEEGRYSTLFKVYGRQKDPLGNDIATKKTKDKRTIYWCPTVQV